MRNTCLTVLAILLAGNQLAATSLAEQAAAKRSSQEMLAAARDVAEQRTALIDRQMQEVQRAIALGPEGVARIKQGMLERVDQTPKSGRNDLTSEQIEELIEYEYGYENFLLGQISRLGRLRPVEAAHLAVQYVDLVRESKLRKGRSPGAELLKAAGRSGAAVIIDRLRSDGQLPEAKRQRLLEVLRQIEGPATDALLENPPPVPPAWQPPKPPAVPPGALPLRFVMMPGIRMPNYQGRSTKSVLRLSDGAVVEGPEWTEPDNEEAYRQAMETLVKQVGQAGDLAFLEVDAVIPSRRYAKLKEKRLASLFGKDLSSHIATRTQSNTCIPGGEILLIETNDGKYALVQHIARQQVGAVLGYVYQPDGSATFQVTPPPSWLQLISADPMPSYGEQSALRSYHSKIRNDFWDDFRRSIEDLQGLLDGSVQEVTLEQKGEALELLGDLRYFESADLIVSYLDTQFPGVAQPADHPAIKALANIEPSARPVLLHHIRQAADPQRRQQLSDALKEIEGPVAGQAWLDDLDAESR